MLCLGASPQRSFHDVTSGGDRDIKGLSDLFLITAQRGYVAVSLLLKGWLQLYVSVE